MRDTEHRITPNRAGTMRKASAPLDSAHPGADFREHGSAPHYTARCSGGTSFIDFWRPLTSSRVVRTRSWRLYQSCSVL